MMKNRSVRPGAAVGRHVPTQGIMMSFWRGGTVLSPDCGGDGQTQSIALWLKSWKCTLKTFFPQQTLKSNVSNGSRQSKE